MTLEAIQKRAKCGIYLSINEHRDYYESITEYLETRHGDDTLAPDVLKRIIETDTLVTLQVYPDTPIGSYLVIHYNVDEAISEMAHILEE